MIGTIGFSSQKWLINTLVQVSLRHNNCCITRLCG
ncbi:hypothetical protein CIPAW_02G111000 [Carya illinoinensis]|uniref:Uncharacterized protein n=1 Tax=Carya illinoinensis TaxID=32201 RepID=A0A8T1RCA7_CARIL|nr:hypothetical protein CIPAW_02G111000 [Carya illinoinensis]